MRPHRRQPNRLLRPWDFPGESTGVGCHGLLLVVWEVGPISEGLVALATWVGLSLPIGWQLFKNFQLFAGETTLNCISQMRGMAWLESFKPGLKLRLSSLERGYHCICQDSSSVTSCCKLEMLALSDLRDALTKWPNVTWFWSRRKIQCHSPLRASCPKCGLQDAQVRII